MLTEHRVRLKLEGLPATAQRVYEAVPVESTWTTAEIATELRRTGSLMTIEKVVWNLRHLLEARLVAEPVQRCFRRTAVRAAPTKSVLEPPLTARQAAVTPPPPTTPLEVLTMPTKPTATAAKNHIDALGAVSAKLREQAAALLAHADEIDGAALALQERVEGSTANDELIRNMRKLFAVEVPA